MMRIQLFQRRQITDLIAIVDNDVYPLLMARRWSAFVPRAPSSQGGAAGTEVRAWRC
jgi:hypothetical protein